MYFNNDIQILLSYLLIGLIKIIMKDNTTDYELLERNGIYFSSVYNTKYWFI